MIINSTLEEVQNENLMGYVSDHLLLEFRQNQDVTVEELTTSLHRVLQLNNNRTVRVQLNGREMEPVSDMGRQVSLRTSLVEVRELMRGRFDSMGREHEETESFDITSLDVVTPRQCERLVRRSLARQRLRSTEHVECEMAPT